MLAHGLTSARNADGMDAIGARWAREGAAVAAIDFALHGERASAKLSERLFATSGRWKAMDGRRWAWSAHHHAPGIHVLDVHVGVHLLGVAHGGIGYVGVVVPR